MRCHVTVKHERHNLLLLHVYWLLSTSVRQMVPLLLLPSAGFSALDLPLKALVWPSEDGRVWVSSTSAAYLRVRYALPQELIGNIAVVDVLIEQALQG